MGNILAVEPDAAARRLDQPQDAARHRGFAAAGLADQPERFADAEREADAIDGMHGADLAAQNAAAHRIVFDEVGYFEQDARLGTFPYLADDYALCERVTGESPWISDIHLFAIASTMSFGASGSSINAMTTAVPKLVHGLTRGLFRADLDKHWAAFQAYDVRQAEIRRPSER